MIILIITTYFSKDWIWSGRETWGPLRLDFQQVLDYRCRSTKNQNKELEGAVYPTCWSIWKLWLTSGGPSSRKPADLMHWCLCDEMCVHLTQKTPEPQQIYQFKRNIHFSNNLKFSPHYLAVMAKVHIVI